MIGIIRYSYSSQEPTIQALSKQGGAAGLLRIHCHTGADSSMCNTMRLVFSKLLDTWDGSYLRFRMEGSNAEIVELQSPNDRSSYFGV
jgi:hypothetical protein